MTTSNPHKLVLFKKKDCAPCNQAEGNLNSILEKHPKFRQYVTQMWTEYHPALVAAYELTLFPTLLILDTDLNEMARHVGSNKMTKDFWFKALTTIHHKENTK